MGAVAFRLTGRIDTKGPFADLFDRDVCVCITEWLALKLPPGLGSHLT